MQNPSLQEGTTDQMVDDLCRDEVVEIRRPTMEERYPGYMSESIEGAIAKIRDTTHKITKGLQDE